MKKETFVIFVIFLNACVLREDTTSGRVEMGAEEERVEEVAPEIDWELYFQEAVVDWAGEYGLGDEWIDWMFENRARYINPFRFSRSQNQIDVSFWYYGARINYDPEWESEDVHMSALEELAELTYPEWEFNFMRGEGEETADVILHTNSSSSNCCSGERRNTIRVRKEGIFMHEFSHFVGNHHHYTSMATYGDGEYMSPGESVCLMDRNSVQFCSACRFALGIPNDVDNEERIHELLEEVNGRYPEGY